MILTSADDFIFFLQGAKSSGARLSVETCPHYLAFSAENIPDRDTRFKCAPPIRDAANNQKLWEALMVLFYVYYSYFSSMCIIISMIKASVVKGEFSLGISISFAVCFILCTSA